MSWSMAVCKSMRKCRVSFWLRCGQEWTHTNLVRSQRTIAARLSLSMMTKTIMASSCLMRWRAAVLLAVCSQSCASSRKYPDCSLWPDNADIRGYHREDVKLRYEEADSEAIASLPKHEVPQFHLDMGSPTRSTSRSGRRTNGARPPKHTPVPTANRQRKLSHLRNSFSSEHTVTEEDMGRHNAGNDSEPGLQLPGQARETMRRHMQSVAAHQPVFSDEEFEDHHDPPALDPRSSDSSPLQSHSLPSNGAGYTNNRRQTRVNSIATEVPDNLSVPQETTIARAKVDATLAVIPAEAFKKLTKKFPKASAHIVQGK